MDVGVSGAAIANCTDVGTSYGYTGHGLDVAKPLGLLPRALVENTRKKYRTPGMRSGTM